MSSWIQRVGALLGGRAPAAVVAVPRQHAHREAARVRVALAQPVPVAATPAVVEPAISDPQQPFFEWLLDAAAMQDVPLLPHEHRLLARLDAVLRALDRALERHGAASAQPLH